MKQLKVPKTELLLLMTKTQSTRDKSFLSMLLRGEIENLSSKYAYERISEIRKDIKFREEESHV